MASPEVELLKSGNGFPEVVTDQEDDEHDAKESVLQKYFLQEWRVVKCVLENIVSSDGAVEHSAVHKIRSIIDKYQEQGQLLEPYLESMVSPLMILIRSKIIELDQGVYSHEILEVIRSLCIIIYSLVTVCGYKAVIKFFPHQVSDLEAAVFLLGKCHDTNAATSLREESTGEMESKCVILLWLSILVLVPFDISSVDTSIRNSNDLGEYEPAPLVLRLLALSKDYLSSAGPMRKISGLLLSKLLTRPDMPKAFSSFIGWSHEVLSSTTDHLMDHFQLLGAVEALCAIFKAGSRELLLDVIPTVWNDTSILIKTKTAARSPLLRKLVMKLTQKIGLIRLPRRSPSWQYVSKTTSLRDNRISNASSKTNECNHTVNAPNLVPMLSCQEDEDMDVPEIVEEIIGILLSGLRDTDTVVRWSAAKGIGRMTSRLTSILADEILCSLLELFSAGEGDASWHGGCLALAELARRGLLLPISLPKVVPVVVKALHYDIRRGPHSIGSHVRDAAAYVCWAFGRAYIHTDMKSILEQLAPNLLIVACYDREVNCRRAAAAAFQENVGRQGNYPHGINIVNTADYFSLSSRVNSYLHVAVSVAQYEGYLYPFVEELLNSKICHWEKGLREIAAEALSALVKYDPEYFAHFVMEKVAPCTLSNDLCMRHGATLAAGEVSLALHRLSYALSTDMQKLLAGMVPAIEKARLYRGKGGEIMRSAVSRFIHCISLVCIHLPAKTKQSLLDTLNENLRHPNDRIQKAAAEALKYFVPAYFVPADGGASIDIIQKYLEQLTDANVATRRGAALGLGVLPYGFLAKRWRAVLLKLCNSCAIEDNPEDRDTEARVNAVKALVSVSETINQARGHAEHSSEEDGTSFFLLIKNEILTSLFVALDDYSVDNRGDVGSWVREASIYGLERCTYMLCKEHAIRSYNKMVEDSQSQLFFDMNLANRIVGGILKQAVEKMDKIREVAAKTLQRILYNDTVFVPFIPYREKLEEVIPKEADLNWGVPVFSYPRIVQLLSLSCYSRYLLSGLVISVGGLQDSLRKASLSALLKYLQANEDEICSERSSREIMLYKDMLWLLEQYKKCDRVIIPTLKTIEILLSKKIFLNMEAHTTIFCSGISDSLAVELKGAKDFSKLYAGIAILGYIASIAESVNTPSFSQLLSFLDHRFPKIRKAAAEQVYLVLLQNGILVAEDKMDKALEVVSEACWEGDIKEAKNRRWQLYDIVGTDKGPLHANGGALNTGCPKRPADENASYSSLVESSGF